MKKDEKGITEQTIHIVVKRIMGKVPVIVGEFDAIQERDNNFNITAVNEDYNFREELDISKHNILDFLKYKLELRNFSNEKKLEKLDEKIKQLEDIMKDYKAGKIPNDKPFKVKKETLTPSLRDKVTEEDIDEQGFVFVNKIDLEDEITQYKVLRYAIENDGEGSYEIINATGKRQMEFCIIEGVLYPYFHRTNTSKGTVLTMYPDITSKRKFYKEADDRILEDFLKSQNDGIFTGIKGIIITIAIVILFITGTILHVRVNTRGQELDLEIENAIAPYREIANQNSVYCAYYYTKLLENEIINRSIINATTPATQDRRTPTGSVVDISQGILG